MHRALREPSHFTSVCEMQKLPSFELVSLETVETVPAFPGPINTQLKHIGVRVRIITC